MKTILLTFDVEEADILRDYETLDKEKEFELSKQGLLRILKILDKYNTKATFFTTAIFAQKYPQLIKAMHENNHEIACHGYHHSDNYLENQNFPKINKAKKQIERIIKNKINGFRAPRLQIKKISRLSNYDFLYDSSIHPTWIPKRYCNLSKKRKIHKIKSIIEIPPSTLPLVRFPIAWIFFKNLTLNYAKLFTRINFLSSNYTMLFFHPWEFSDLSNTNLPPYIKKNPLKMLEKYIVFCKKNKYSFNTISNFLSYTNTFKL